MTERELREQIVETGRRCYEKGYIVAADGNISTRLENGNILVTPSGVNKGFMTSEMLVEVGLDGKHVRGSLKASTELPMHLLVYRERPDVQAIVHAHPPTGTGFAVAGIALDKALISEVVLTLGCIPLAGYGTPSTDELTDALRPYVKYHDALLMANHGAVTFGPTVELAFWRMETLEHFAKIALVAKMLGREVQLSNDEVARLLEIRSRSGVAAPESTQCLRCGWSGTETAGQSSSLSAGVAAPNGDESVTLTRNELITLITEAARRVDVKVS